MTYAEKLKTGQLSDLDRKVIDWQRTRMDAFGEDGEPRDPTDEDAALVLDELRAEAETYNG